MERVEAVKEFSEEEEESGKTLKRQRDVCREPEHGDDGSGFCAIGGGRGVRRGR